MLYCFRYEIFLFKRYLEINQFMTSINSFCPLLHFIQVKQQNEKSPIKQKSPHTEKLHTKSESDSEKTACS